MSTFIIAADGKRYERRSEFFGSKRHHFIDPDTRVSMCGSACVGEYKPSDESAPCMTCLAEACAKPKGKKVAA